MNWRKRSAKARKVPQERFTMLPVQLLTDVRWTFLPAAARVILVDMSMLHHHGGVYGPTNNGEIGYGGAAGAKAANGSTATAHRMLVALRKSGLILLRREGAFKMKAGEGRTHEWEITIYPMPGHSTGSWGDRKLHLGHSLLRSAAYIDLSNSAKCILLELMRRFDGGNNGLIRFGGPDGAHAGFSADVTERALTDLRQAGFIVQTGPAVPHRRLGRLWRLTMYAASDKAATKEFMRRPSAGREKSQRDLTAAGDPRQNVSVMRSPAGIDLPVPGTDIKKGPSGDNSLADIATKSGTRAGEAFEAPDSRANEIHLETSERGRCLPTTAHTARGSSEATAPARLGGEPFSQPTSPVVNEEPADLFGDALPSLLTPQDELRVKLRSMLSRRRGTQSRLAAAVGLSRSTFAHALSGRCGFTLTAAAALRGWLDGHPLAGQWPALPPAAEDENAA